MKAEDIFAKSDIDISLHVTVQLVQEETYSYDINGNKGEYHRLLVALGNLDAENPFHRQIFLVLKENADPAYPLLAKAEKGDTGVLSLSISLPILKRKMKDQSNDLYVQESTIAVQNFIKDGE